MCEYEILDVFLRVYDLEPYHGPILFNLNEFDEFSFSPNFLFAIFYNFSSSFRSAFFDRTLIN